MYIKFDNCYCDSDLQFLKELFALLDERFDDLQRRIDDSFDPDQMGLFDEAEYLSGMGFIACQRYLASTYGPVGVAKKDALSVGPKYDGGEPFAQILHAAANYWKHVDEWDTNAVILRDRHALRSDQQDTIRIIETVTAWSDYTCANLLTSLARPGKPRLAVLVPMLEAWRDQFDSCLG